MSYESGEDAAFLRGTNRTRRDPHDPQRQRTTGAEEPMIWGRLAEHMRVDMKKAALLVAGRVGGGDINLEDAATFLDMFGYHDLQDELELHGLPKLPERKSVRP